MKVIIIRSSCESLRWVKISFIVDNLKNSFNFTSFTKYYCCVCCFFYLLTHNSTFYIHDMCMPSFTINIIDRKEKKKRRSRKINSNASHSYVRLMIWHDIKIGILWHHHCERVSGGGGNHRLILKRAFPLDFMISSLIIIIAAMYVQLRNEST